MNMTVLESKEFIRRFWSKVDVRSTKECWNWKAATQSKGYGSFGVGTGKTQLAHRVSYMLEVGVIPEGLLVRHKCDNKLCCNVNHLELGTIADNNHDAVLRGRNAKGERSGRAKLKDIDVKQIRQDYKIGKYTIPQLASLYRVSGTNVRSLVNNKHWKMPLAG